MQVVFHIISDSLILSAAQDEMHESIFCKPLYSIDILLWMRWDFIMTVVSAMGQFLKLLFGLPSLSLGVLFKS